MSRIIFLDTAFLIALLKPSDEFHARATAWRDRLLAEECSYVTSEAVLWEMLDAFAVVPTRRKASSAYTSIHNDTSVRVVGFDRDLCGAAIALFANRTDKEWSTTDCLSFEIMRRDGIHEALTSDHHFEQAGYTALFRRQPGD